MSFKPIRTYLSDRIEGLDSDYTEHDDAFNIDNIGDLEFDKAYHIFYGDVVTTEANQNTTSDLVTATVSIFSQGHRDPKEALDDAMDFANLFRIECLKPVYLSNEQFLKQVKCISIKAEPLATNDNAIVVRLEFSILVIFGLGVNLDN